MECNGMYVGLKRTDCPLVFDNLIGENDEKPRADSCH